MFKEKYSSSPSKTVSVPNVVVIQTNKNSRDISGKNIYFISFNQIKGQALWQFYYENIWWIYCGNKKCMIKNCSYPQIHKYRM